MIFTGRAHTSVDVLVWPKSGLGIFPDMVPKLPNKFFGQPSSNAYDVFMRRWKSQRLF